MSSPARVELMNSLPLPPADRAVPTNAMALGERVREFMAPVLLRLPEVDAIERNPSRTHQTASSVRPATADVQANGSPLSERIAFGSP